MNIYRAFMLFLILLEVAMYIVGAPWTALFGAPFIAIVWLYFEWQIKLSNDDMDKAYAMFDEYQPEDLYRGY